MISTSHTVQRTFSPKVKGLQSAKKGSRLYNNKVRDLPKISVPIYFTEAAIILLWKRVTYVKNPRRKRISKKAIEVTIAIPLLLCVVIILCRLFDYLRILRFVDTSITLSEAVLENIYNNQSLTLSLIGIAIAVWIGLNIYNVVSKEELNILLEQAEQAAKITQSVYTEVLKSKFRLSVHSSETAYFADQLELIDQLPAEVLQDMITLEDMFSLSYRLYANGRSTIHNERGIRFAEILSEKVEDYRKNAVLTSEQFSFLKGYISLRWGDFLYFQAQYGDYSASERAALIEEAVKKYKKAVFRFFKIRDIALCTNPELYQPSERECIAYLGNNIGSAYLLSIVPAEKINLEEVIAAETVAITFSAEISPEVREVFVRNLGVAYERKNEMNMAFKQYCRAYRLNQNNWKTAHCIASWYRKQISRRFPQISSLLTLKKEQISKFSKADKAELEYMLKKSAYWYKRKQTNNHGKSEENLITLYKCLYQLTNDKKYIVLSDIYQEEDDYTEEIMATDIEAI